MRPELARYALQPPTQPGMECIGTETPRAQLWPFKRARGDLLQGRGPVEMEFQFAGLLQQHSGWQIMPVLQGLDPRRRILSAWIVNRKSGRKAIQEL